MQRKCCTHLQNASCNWEEASMHAQACERGNSHFCASCLEPVKGGELGNGGTKALSCSKGHNLIVDVARMELFCAACNDFAYCKSWDKAVQLANAAQRYVCRGITPGEPANDPASQVRAKRQRMAAEPGHSLDGGAGTQGAAVHLAAVKGLSLLNSKDGLPLGLRGLNNLGNTCFMNAVLQALIHSPLVRNFFLSDGHSPAMCRKRSSRPCLGCEMDAVFSSMHSGEREPLSPVDFLFSWWSHADTLAEYQQQDAHEFYLSALSGLSSAVIAPVQLPEQPAASNGVGPETGGAAQHTAAFPYQGGSMGQGAPSGLVPDSQAGTPAPSTLTSLSGLGPTGAAEPPGTHIPGQPSAAGASWMESEEGEPSVSQRHVARAHLTHMPAASAPLPSLPRFGDTTSQPGFSGAGHARTATQNVSIGPGLREPSVTANSGDSYSRGPTPTKCELNFVEAVFGGLLRSDVMCRVCGHTSTAYDPFLDISLDMVAVAKRPNSHIPPLSTDAFRPPLQPVALQPQAAPSHSPHHTLHSPHHTPHRQSSASIPASALPSLSAGGADEVSGIGLPGASAAAGGGPTGMGARPPHRLHAVGVPGSRGVLDHGQSDSGSQDAVLGERPGVRQDESSMQEGEGPPRRTPEISDDSNVHSIGNGITHSRPSVLRFNKLGGAHPAQPVPSQRQAVKALDAPVAPAQTEDKPQLSLPELSLDAAESQLDAGRRSVGHAAGGTGGPAAADPALEDSMSSPLRVSARTQQLGLALQPHTPSGRIALGGRGREISLAQGLGTHSLQGGGAEDAEAVVEESPVLAPVPAAASGGQTSTQGFAFTAPGASTGAAATTAAASSPAADATVAAVGGSTGSKKGVASKREAAAAPKSAAAPRVTRCGQCFTCLNKYLKKACMRNQALKEGRTWDAEAAAAAALSPAKAAPAKAAAAVQPPAALPIQPAPGATAAAPATARGEAANGGAANDGATNGRKAAQAPAPVPSAPAQAAPAAAAAAAGGGGGGVLVERASTHLQMSSAPWPVGQGQHAVTAQAGDEDIVMADAPAAQPESDQAAPAEAGRTAWGGDVTGPHITGVVHGPAGALTLAACLRHFVQPEALSSSESWVCSHCKRRQPALKQMSIRRLPPLLCMHLKRFEHCPGSRRIVRKLQAQLAFPTHCLDLEPYLSATVLRQRYMVRGIDGLLSQDQSGDGPDDGLKQEDGLTASIKRELKTEETATGLVGNGAHTSATDGHTSFRYMLYAVICHKGDITGGHYVVYVRTAGAWFLCDDAWVTLVEEEEVARCQAYMLFFCSEAFYDSAALGLAGPSD